MIDIPRRIRTGYTQDCEMEELRFYGVIVALRGWALGGVYASKSARNVFSEGCWCSGQSSELRCIKPCGKLQHTAKGTYPM